jgi:hypothetical protein
MACRMKFFSLSVEGKRLVTSAHVVSLVSFVCGVHGVGEDETASNTTISPALQQPSRHQNEDVYAERFFPSLPSLVCSVITVYPTVIRKTSSFSGLSLPPPLLYHRTNDILNSDTRLPTAASLWSARYTLVALNWNH